MPSTVVIVLLSLLLISSLYSTMMWLDLFGMRTSPFWRRAAVASAIGHVILLGGFLVLAYVDFRETSSPAGGGSFTAFLFNDPDFWRVFLVFDTLAAVTVLGVLGVLDALGTGAGAIFPVFVAASAGLGTLQWFVLGGLAGKGVDRLLSGLRTPDDEMPDWF